MKYLIHEANIPRLEKKFASIERKCSKYNQDFSYSQTAEILKETEKDSGIFNKFIEVNVSGTAKNNGWEFIATLEHLTTGNIIRNIAEIEIPDFYKSCIATCDHCGTNRKRKDTYIVRNIETNEFKQVGKSCLMEYTNGLNVNAIASFLELFDCLAEFESHDTTGTTEKYFSAEMYLQNVTECVKKFGYVKKSQDENFNYTCNVALDFMTMTAKERDYKNFSPYNAENVTTVKNAIEWLKNENSENDYIRTLKTIVFDNDSNMMKSRHVGYVASLIPSYFRFLEKQETETRKKDNNVSQFVGTEKEKIEILAVAKFVASYETQYGYTHIYKFIDENGNIFIWHTAKNIENDLGHELNDEKIKIKGTIKGHTEFNDEKQTIITRCKIA